jgi:hypothetical protein
MVAQNLMVDPSEPHLEPDKTRLVTAVSPRLPIHIRPLGEAGFELALLVPPQAAQGLFEAAEASHSDRREQYRQVFAAVIASL